MRTISYIAAVALTAAVVAGCSSGPGQITVKGNLLGVTSDNAYTVGKAMNLLPGVCDVTGTSQVKVLGGKGQELAWSPLKPGHIIAMPGTPGQGAEIYTYSMTVPAGQGPYEIQVGTASPVPFTATQLSDGRLTCS